MEHEELEQKLSNIEKKQDKILNLLTKIAKALHLLPVSEKEEREIQIQQRANFAMQAKVNDDLDKMENKEGKVDTSHDLSSIYNDIAEQSPEFVYEDVLGSDILSSMKEKEEA